MSIKGLWKQLWESQGKKCAECGKFVALNNTAKSRYSFKIVCQDCYNKPSNIVVIMDEFSNYTDEVER